MFAYVVRHPFDWNGETLARGTALTDSDARDLEKSHLLHNCVRVHDAALDKPKEPTPDSGAGGSPISGPVPLPPLSAAPAVSEVAK